MLNSSVQNKQTFIINVVKRNVINVVTLLLDVYEFKIRWYDTNPDT